MPPQRSVIPDPELCEHARGKPFRVPLAAPGDLNDPARDKFGFVISGTDGKHEPRARSVERLAHGFNVLRLEGESMRSKSWHRGAAGVCSGTPTYTISLNRVSVICI